MSVPRNGSKSHTGKLWNAARLAPRFSSLCDLSVSYEGHSEDIATRPPDISTRGMFINTSRTFPDGAVLNVSFRLALSGVQIRSRCEVRYCLPGVGVGVEFIEISPDDVLAIEHEIKLGTRERPKKKVSSRR
jgi:hypothetical protein